MEHAKESCIHWNSIDWSEEVLSFDSRQWNSAFGEAGRNTSSATPLKTMVVWIEFV
jgi:hypothetical protein